MLLIQKQRERVLYEFKPRDGVCLIVDSNLKGKDLTDFCIALGLGMNIRFIKKTSSPTIHGDFKASQIEYLLLYLKGTYYNTTKDTTRWLRHNWRHYNLKSYPNSRDVADKDSHLFWSMIHGTLCIEINWFLDCFSRGSVETS